MFTLVLYLWFQGGHICWGCLWVKTAAVYRLGLLLLRHFPPLLSYGTGTAVRTLTPLCPWEAGTAAQTGAFCPADAAVYVYS